MSNELAWLIEAKITPALWLQADPIQKTYRWTADANEAVRFARKQDAENMIGLWSLCAAAAVEHMWCDPPSALETRSELNEVECDECGAKGRGAGKLSLHCLRTECPGRPTANRGGDYG